jgi:hypothetical protein
MPLRMLPSVGRDVKDRSAEVELDPAEVQKVPALWWVVVALVSLIEPR